MPSDSVVYPSEDIHQLRISFPLPSVDEHWRIKPADYVRFIFTHEAPGSLNSYLKTKYVIRASTTERSELHLFLPKAMDNQSRLR